MHADDAGFAINCRMPEINVSVLFKSPPEAVFAALTDHVRFFQGKHMACRLLQEGDSEANGLGAVREIHSGAFVFTEAVTRFERPSGFDYLVSNLRHASGLKLPFRHERGWLDLIAEDGGTRVVWRSRFTVAVPLLGRLLEQRFADIAGRGFEKLLLAARSRLDPAATA